MKWEANGTHASNRYNDNYKGMFNVWRAFCDEMFFHNDEMHSKMMCPLFSHPRTKVSPKLARVPQEGGWCRGGSRNSWIMLDT